MKFSISALASLLAISSLAGAQNATPVANTAPTKAQRAPLVPRPLAGSQTSQIQAMMAANGGSLLQASLAATPDPMQARLRDVSYFSVPEPTPHTLKKHDIVTVIVREDSAFKSNGTTDVKEQQDFDAKLDAFIQIKLKNAQIKGLPTPTNIPEIKGESLRDFKGEGEVDRTDSLTARIAVEVVDVKPNGTLVLQGSKRIKTDEEEQQFILTGTCRVEDIQGDDTILSNQLYDLSLEKKHQGAVRDATKRGFLTKFLDKFNPF